MLQRSPARLVVHARTRWVGVGGLVAMRVIVATSNAPPLALVPVALALALVDRPHLSVDATGVTVANVRTTRIPWSDVARVESSSVGFATYLTVVRADGRLLRAWAASSGRGNFTTREVTALVQEVRRRQAAAQTDQAARRVSVG